MSQINRIEPKQIEQLGPQELVRLLNLLLLAEAKEHLLVKHGIHVPFQITVPDGGRDAKWDAEIGSHEYIPRKLTYYQCKAQYLTDGDCKEEIVKEKAKEVLDKGGAYVFFSSHPCVRFEDRIAAAREPTCRRRLPLPGLFSIYTRAGECRVRRKKGFDLGTRETLLAGGDVFKGGQGFAGLCGRRERKICKQRDGAI